MAPLILFDLDGTLIDSAPALVASANRLRTARGMPALPFEALRGSAGKGARGLIWAALNMPEDDPAFDATRKEFLDDYAEHCDQNVLMFEGIKEMLIAIESHGWDWGIVTNKYACFTHPIIKAAGLASRTKVVICGDETFKLKPAPDHLEIAIERTGHKACDCVYIGDDIRDAQAAKAIGLAFAAAAWGYLGDAKDTSTWGADYVAKAPLDLIPWFEHVCHH